MTAEESGRLPRSVLDIDLGAVRANWRDLAARAAGADCAAAVKADAYGLGIDRVAPALWAEGCRSFFVASLDEATTLRALLPTATIAVLDGVHGGEGRDFVAHRLIPVIGDLAQLDHWRTAVRAAEAALPAILHVDTGINRLGLTPAEVDRLAETPERMAGPDWRALMSHLACADDPADPMNARQRDRLLAIGARLPRMPLSLANSGGVLLGPDYHFDLVRPGIAVYGGRASDGGPNPMRPTVTLSARVLQVRDVAAGEAVGYGATHRPTGDARIAVVATGYADGYHRALGDAAAVAFAGARLPVVGRVSMDMITVDVTPLGAREPRAGDLVELIGPTIALDDVAAAAGTIGYEILTALGRRHERRYRDGPAGDRTGDA